MLRTGMPNQPPGGFRLRYTARGETPLRCCHWPCAYSCPTSFWRTAEASWKNVGQVKMSLYRPLRGCHHWPARRGESRNCRVHRQDPLPRAIGRDPSRDTDSIRSHTTALSALPEWIYGWRPDEVRILAAEEAIPVPTCRRPPGRGMRTTYGILAGAPYSCEHYRFRGLVPPGPRGR